MTSALAAPSVPPEEFCGKFRLLDARYWPHGCGGISAKPKTPREPTSESALVLIGEQLCACARGTLRDEAGALPIKITIATVARILVVRMDSPRVRRNFRPRIYAQIRKQVVNTYTDGPVKPLVRL
ncbi:MAG TPA: hypothetical protein VJM79_01900 [Rhizorhapis sp.]|nr:hypothetical protein [Rhizorhapis sp.]